MSEHSELLAQMVDRLFGDVAQAGRPDPQAWQGIEELGIADLFLAEAAGGMDGGWRDAEPVFRLGGFHGLGLPVGETMIARKLLAQAGIGVPEGMMAVGQGRGTISPSGAVSASVRALSSSPANMWLLAVIRDEGRDCCVLVDPARAHHREQAANMAGEARDRFTFDGAPCELVEGVDAERVLHLFAFLRTAQIAGALAACLERCIRYSQERSQFGRELRKFQAIQHQIALIAEEAGAVASASASAAAALDRGGAAFEVACAKLRANQATGASALIAHQVHGAIGITEEYGLHRFTGRLWAWRSEFGNDRFWAQRLGEHMLSETRGSPWHVLTGRSAA